MRTWCFSTVEQCSALKRGNFAVSTEGASTLASQLRVPLAGSRATIASLLVLMGAFPLTLREKRGLALSIAEVTGGKRFYRLHQKLKLENF